MFAFDFKTSVGLDGIKRLPANRIVCEKRSYAEQSNRTELSKRNVRRLLRCEEDVSVPSVFSRSLVFDHPLINAVWFDIY